MIFLQALPHPVLQEYIAQYLFVSVADSNEFGKLTQKFFPIDIPCLAFYSKKLGIGGNEQLPGSEAYAVYSGLIKSGSCISFQERDSVWGFIVSFKPHGFTELFGIDHSEIITITDFYTIRGKEGELLHEQLDDAGSFAEQVTIADAYFLKKKPAFEHPSPIREVCKQIIARNGAVDIKGLTSFANLSLSSLERKFTKIVGVSPKQFVRIKRFHHALKLMTKPILTLTDIAHTCGYYDQAHFIRDFESFTGQPPSLFRPEDYAFYYQFILLRNYYH